MTKKEKNEVLLMKVYLLESMDYLEELPTTDSIGIFSTEEKAKEYMIKNKLVEKKFLTYYITEYEVDNPE